MSKASKSTKKSTLSKAQRSNIARKAAAGAWKFMRSVAYQRIINSSKTEAQQRKAIEALKAARA
jgi:hypothetical protein